MKQICPHNDETNMLPQSTETDDKADSTGDTAIESDDEVAE